VIVISGALVLVALVLLVVGLTMTDLPFVYGSIAVSLLALVFLVLGILQRRNEQLPSGDAAPSPQPEPQPLPAPTTTTAMAIPAADLRKPAAASVRGEEDPPVEQDAEELDEQVGGYVLVVPGRPRYHVDGCRYLAGKDVEEVGVLDARDEGFTPCGVCKPDEALAAQVELDDTLEEVVTEDSEQALDAADISAVEPVEQEPLAAADDELAADGEETAVVAPAEVPVDESALEEPALPLLPAEEPARRGRGSKAVATAPRKAARAATRAVSDAPAAPAPALPTGPAPRKRATAAAPAKKAPARSRAAAGAPDVATPTRSARKAPGAVVEVPASAAAPAAPAAPAKKAARAAAVATPAGAAAKRGSVVVIPDRGRFHRAECRYVRGAEDAVELTKTAASRQGYAACGVCRP
jgi:hypothetical protein